jgi:hypothetical protein
MNDGEHMPRLKGIEGGGVGDWRIAPLHVVIIGGNGQVSRQKTAPQGRLETILSHMPAAGKYTVRRQPPKDADVVCLIRTNYSHMHRPPYIFIFSSRSILLHSFINGHFR